MTAEETKQILGNYFDSVAKVADYLSDSDRKQLYELLKKLEDPNKGAIEKRQDFIKDVLADKGLRSWAKIALPDMYKEGLKIERGDKWKPSLKDVQKALDMTDDEIFDAEKGWQGMSGQDIDMLAKMEGMTCQDVLKILQEAQTKHDRQKNWQDASFKDKLLMNAVAPFTSEKLSKGEDVNDMTAADKAGMLAGLIPAGNYIKAVGPIGRTIADAFVAPIVSSAAGYASGEMTPGEALVNAGAGGSSNMMLGGALKSGWKGVKGLGSSVSKVGKKALNESEDALKEGFYRTDFEQKIKKIKDAIESKNINELSNDEIKLLKAFNSFKELGVDLDKLGTFSQDKLDNYLAELKTAVSPKTTENLFKRREAIKEAQGDPIDQVRFDVNPGTVRFMDKILGVSDDKLKKVGWSKAGLGTPRKKIEATLEGHKGISNEEIPDLASLRNKYMAERQLKTDPVYPRETDMDIAVEEYLKANPQLKLYFDKSYGDPAVRDYIVQVLIPNILTRTGRGFTNNSMKTEDKEKE